MKAAVIGFPIHHSLSPRIHNFWLKQYGIEGGYEAIEVSPEELGTFVKSLEEKGFKGINVTLPHKEQVMKYLDEVSDVAQEIGAVNTVTVEEGVLKGTNSDHSGFIKNLTSHVPDFDFTLGKAVVIGAGGAAKAICAALASVDVPEIVIMNRTRQKAEAIQKQQQDVHKGIKIDVVEWEERDVVLAGTHLLINTSSLGMVGQPPLSLNLEKLPVEAMVTDIVYNPLKTELLLEAEARGNIIVDGLGMLLYQAAVGFEKWFGVEPEVTEALRTHVQAGIV